MRDALKSYLELANGITEVTRQRAVAAAQALVQQGEAAAGQVSELAEDLVAQSRQNRESLAALVKYEVDRTLGRVGLAAAGRAHPADRAGAGARGAAPGAEPGRRCIGSSLRDGGRAEGTSQEDGREEGTSQDDGRAEGDREEDRREEVGREEGTGQDDGRAEGDREEDTGQELGREADRQQGDRDQGDRDQGDRDQGDRDQGDRDQGDRDQGGEADGRQDAGQEERVGDQAHLCPQDHRRDRRMSEQQPPPAHPPAAALTGVDAALGRLNGVAQLPVEEHVAVFDEVHRLLQDALATLDSA